jgi:hypothetical protein
MRISAKFFEYHREKEYERQEEISYYDILCVTEHLFI